jgi:hypothetical protein
MLRKLIVSVGCETLGIIGGTMFRKTGCEQLGRQEENSSVRNFKR